MVFELESNMPEGGKENIHQDPKSLSGVLKFAVSPHLNAGLTLVVDELLCVYLRK
jgi:hypothetical protein